jgi:hypothetical protein
LSLCACFLSVIFVTLLLYSLLLFYVFVKYGYITYQRFNLYLFIYVSGVYLFEFLRLYLSMNTYLYFCFIIIIFLLSYLNKYLFENINHFAAFRIKQQYSDKLTRFVLRFVSTRLVSILICRDSFEGGYTNRWLIT